MAQDPAARRPPTGKAGRRGDEGNEGSPIGRRVFLGMVGLGAVGVVVGAKVQNVLGDVIRPLQSEDPTGLTDLLPGGNGWRYYTITDGFPSESAAQYRLNVDGLVDHPMTLTIEDLQAMPPTTLVRDFQCVTGWRVPKVHWRGVALSDLLDQAGVHASATALRFESFDGAYTESLTLAQARRPDVIVAYSMLGGPVSTEHGGPVRLYVAPMYGYKSVKWLSRVTLTTGSSPATGRRRATTPSTPGSGASNGRNDPAT